MPNHHLMSVTVAGPNARSHLRTSSVRATSGATAFRVEGSQSAIDAHRGLETVQAPSFGPRTMSPRTDSTVKTLGANGVSPPHRFPGAGS